MSSVPGPGAGAGTRPAVGLLVALGAAIGLSPFASGLYHASAWVPAGLVLLVLLTAALVATPAMPSRQALIAPAALAALALLSLLSAMWTDSIEQAVVAGNRLLVYAACLALFVVLLRSDRAATAAFAAFTVAALVVAGSVLIGMLRGDETIFLTARLHEPLGYVNGQASFFLLAFWPCLALAERRPAQPATEPRRGASALAGLGVAAAMLFAGLAVLAQSRGAVLAAGASIVVVLVLLPGRLRRIVALLVIAAGLAPAMPTLLDVHDERATDAAMRAGAVALLLACAAGGVLWGLLVALERRGVASGLRPRRVVALGVAALVVLAVAAGVASAGRIASVVERQYSAFVALEVEPYGATQSRLSSGAGNRYDYWRIALDAWRAHPLAGVGAGGYDKPYFTRRATVEDVRQPHSMALQVLAELGLAGVLLFAAILLAIVTGAWRRIRDGGRAPLVVAAVGVLSAWFVHASVDWMHLLPGLTGAALLGAAVLTRPAGGDDAAQLEAERAGRAAGLGRARSRAARLAPAIAVALTIALAALSLTRQGLVELYVDRARDALARDPERTLVEANRALRLDREAIAAYHVKAAALARFDDAGAARAVLLDATRREPRNFVTWTLLGDLAVRTGDLGAAGRAYGRASRLNPRDRELARFAAKPQLASRRARGD